MTGAQIRFLFSVFITLFVWRIFERPGVADAFWAFCTVGAIPGSTRIVSSEAVIRALLIIFGCTVFLVFRKEFMASLPVRQPKDTVVPAVVSRKEKPSVVFVIPGQRKPRKPRALPASMLHSIGYAVGWLVYIVSLLTTASEYVLRRCGMFLQYAGRLVYRHGRVALAHSTRASVTSWYFIKPFIHDIDHWIEKKVHENKYTSEMLDIAEACWKNIQSQWHTADRQSRKMTENE